MLLIGIDPGVNTGLAVWCKTERKLVDVRTLTIVEAMDLVREHVEAGRVELVRFEDARKRKWFGGMDARQAKHGAGVREGVGSVKRDCGIWEEFLEHCGAPWAAMPPAKGGTKLAEPVWRQLTKWSGRTSEHARDAAMLVVGA
jgi:hypothetical protein